MEKRYNFYGTLPFGYFEFKTDDFEVLLDVINDFGYKLRRFEAKEDDDV